MILGVVKDILIYKITVKLNYLDYQCSCIYLKCRFLSLIECLNLQWHYYSMYFNKFTILMYFKYNAICLIFIKIKK